MYMYLNYIKKGASNAKKIQLFETAELKKKEPKNKGALQR